MDTIFISYSRKNSDFVDALRARLEKEDYRVWSDCGVIPGGEQWKGEIGGTGTPLNKIYMADSNNAL